MGYQPVASKCPPGYNPPPIGIMSPELLERMDRIAQERHQMGVDEMYACLAYWRDRWIRLMTQGAVLKSTRRKRQVAREEASASCVAWGNRIRNLTVVDRVE